MVYVSNTVLGVLSLPFFALLFTLPYLIYQYARFGAVSVRKTIMVLVFLFYLICMFYQVILPLPADRSAVVSSTLHPQLDPYDVWTKLKSAAVSAGLSAGGLGAWATFLRQPEVYQAFFNVLLTIPFGFMLRYFFKRGVVFSLCAGFVLSLFFETTQLTGLWGIYEHPYRLFDVCDLELNTLGAFVGSVVAIPLVYLLPDLDAANERSVRKGLARVSLTRRLLAFGLDIVASLVLTCVIYGLFHLAMGDGLLSMGESHRLSLLVFLFVATGLLFMLVPVLTKGQTLGQSLVGLHIVCLDGKRPGFVNYFVRYGVLVWGCFLLPLTLGLLAPDSIEGISGQDWTDTLWVMYGLWFLSIVVRGIAAFFGRPMVLLNGYMSNTTIGTSADPRRFRS